MYEALVSGLPIIVPDNPPMNELINEYNGKKVKVSQYTSREDGYYFPYCEVSEENLANAMNYYIDNGNQINIIKENVRKISTNEFNWFDRKNEVEHIFKTTKIVRKNQKEINIGLKKSKSKYIKIIGKALLELSPNKYLHRLGKSKI